MSSTTHLHGARVTDCGRVGVDEAVYVDFEDGHGSRVTVFARTADDLAEMARRMDQAARELRRQGKEAA